jgi:hypothetical protein
MFLTIPNMKGCAILMSATSVPTDADLTESAAPEVFAEPPETAPPKKKGRGRRWVKRIIILLIIAAAVFAAYWILRRMRAGQPTASAEYITETAERRDIVSTLTGNGALTPADSYTVTTLIEGEILSADFEEGNMVEKSSVLYTKRGKTRFWQWRRKKSPRLISCVKKSSTPSKIIGTDVDGGVWAGV